MEARNCAHLDGISEISLALLQMLNNTVEIPHLQQQKSMTSSLARAYSFNGYLCAQ